MTDADYEVALTPSLNFLISYQCKKTGQKAPGFIVTYFYSS